MDDYAEYIRLYNEISEKPYGDYSPIRKKYYHPDMTVNANGISYKGSDGMEYSLKLAHDGVTEKMVVQHMMREGNKILVEVDATLVADRDMPDYMVCPLSKDTPKTLRFLCSYTLTMLVTDLRVYWADDKVLPSMPDMK